MFTRKKVRTSFLTAVIIVACGVALSTGVSYASQIWEGTGWIAPGNVISSERLENALNFLYGESLRTTNQINQLNARVTSVEGMVDTTCQAQQQARSCNIPYSCGCGKHGCGTCYRGGTQTRVVFTCQGTSHATTWSTCR